MMLVRKNLWNKYFHLYNSLRHYGCTVFDDLKFYNQIDSAQFKYSFFSILQSFYFSSELFVTLVSALSGV